MFRKRNPGVGAPPGTLVFRKDPVPARVQIVRYSKDGIETNSDAGLSDVREPIDSGTRLWIDVAGIDDPQILHAGGKQFGLSELIMENIVNVPQRPSSEFHGDRLLSIAHVLRECENGALDVDQLSIVVGRNFVISVHGQNSSFLDPIRRRLQRPDSRIRNNPSSYLAYTILDTAVDSYYPLMESLGEQLEKLEDDALENPHAEVLREIHRLRSKLIQTRRSSWAMRESLDMLLNADNDIFDNSTHTFLRDTRSHCAQIVDVVEMYRESAATLVSTYMSSIAHRSNEIMKVLALVSSIFVPMTFIAGVYGMNFENMPELSLPWSYPTALGAMFITALGMMLFFVRKGWLGPATLGAGLSTEKLLSRQLRNAEQDPPESDNDETQYAKHLWKPTPNHSRKVA